MHTKDYLFWVDDLRRKCFFQILGYYCTIARVHLWFDYILLGYTIKVSAISTSPETCWWWVWHLGMSFWMDLRFLTFVQILDYNGMYLYVLCSTYVCTFQFLRMVVDFCTYCWEQIKCNPIHRYRTIIKRELSIICHLWLMA